MAGGHDAHARPRGGRGGASTSLTAPTVFPGAQPPQWWREVAPPRERTLRELYHDGVRRFGHPAPPLPPPPRAEGGYVYAPPHAELAAAPAAHGWVPHQPYHAGGEAHSESRMPLKSVEGRFSGKFSGNVPVSVGRRFAVGPGVSRRHLSSDSDCH